MGYQSKRSKHIQPEVFAALLGQIRCRDGIGDKRNMLKRYRATRSRHFSRAHVMAGACRNGDGDQKR